MLGRSVTIYSNIYNRFAYYSNIENTLLGMGDRYIEKKIKMKKRNKNEENKKRKIKRNLLNRYFSDFLRFWC